MRWPVLLLLLAAAGAWHHFQRDAEPALHPDDPRIGTADDRIVMLAAEWCGYCRRQQSDFERANVRYRVLDVDTPEGDRAMQAIGARGVPTTIIGQQVVRGYDTAALDQGLRKLGYRVY
ncbi:MULTISPECIES: glutaredoxin domain-containing protein [unclassified Luteimonas]|uniref:glutaredoxin family protein n=1 Tax=Lysobacteraceae TaxID=32033 RepID=UPI00100A6B65|nr:MULTISPECIES: glutaredoxin domain-containing protein [unclassified Luteimonas]MCD9045816.1 glutaredoxin family protein [Luteimonas sp. MHLX1A]